jgi:hypothetical protein
MDRPAVQYAGRGESHAERIVMELSQQRSAQPYGLLYPIMLIAAIAVIVFSILGIASIAGWMPGALSAAATGGAGDRTLPVAVRASATFDCGECRVIDGVRTLEQDALRNMRIAAEPSSRL